jgi:hypothetical protein
MNCQSKNARASDEWCGVDVNAADVDAMDVDSPAPVTAIRPEDIAEGGSSAHRPVTRSQVKQNPTFSRLLVHLEGNSISHQKAVANASRDNKSHSMKRILQVGCCCSVVDFHVATLAGILINANLTIPVQYLRSPLCKRSPGLSNL